MNRYWDRCAECGADATYGTVDGVALCPECAAAHGLQVA